MDKTIIRSENVVVTASSHGGEMHSIRVDGREILFCDERVWEFHAPVMFPICGGLRDDKLVYGGREYTLEKHGYARNTDFVREACDEKSVTYLLKSNSESKRAYPFDYELRIKYTAEKSRVKVNYEVKNTGDCEMYFSIGSHEAYACPEGIESYSIVLEEDEPLFSCIVDGNLMTYEKKKLEKNGNEIKLSPDLFLNDALIFEKPKSGKATLKNNITGKTAAVEFSGCSFLLLWQKPGEKFICIEPWTGCPDFIDSSCDITKKPYITALPAGKTYTKEHTITFE